MMSNDAHRITNTQRKADVPMGSTEMLKRLKQDWVKGK